MSLPKAEVLNLPSNRLKTLSLQTLTQSQVNATGKTVFIPDTVARDDVVSVHKALLAVSTFGATVVPSKGEVKTFAFTDDPAGSIAQPAEGEVWRIDPAHISVLNGSASTNTVTLWLTDGTNSSAVISTVAAAASPTPELMTPTSTSQILKLTNSLYLAVTGSQSDESQLILPIQFEAF